MKTNNVKYHKRRRRIIRTEVGPKIMKSNERDKR